VIVVGARVQVKSVPPLKLPHDGLVGTVVRLETTDRGRRLRWEDRAALVDFPRLGLVRVALALLQEDPS
jgi:hypothetical protein